jgi:hypothetical protein
MFRAPSREQREIAGRYEWNGSVCPGGISGTEKFRKVPGYVLTISPKSFNVLNVLEATISPPSEASRT